jgi:hypothetical protein
MQARKIADCAKSRPGTHPSLIRETKDRPDSNGSVGSLLDLGQKKKHKKNPATFLLTRQPRAINLSPMQARKIADCAKSRPGTHPSQIRETKDRPDSNGSVGSLLDLGQKKKHKKIQPPSFSPDNHGQLT